VYDVITGLRTSPIVEKPPVAAGGPSEVAGGADSEVEGNREDVNEGSVDSVENLDGSRGREDDPTLLAGGSDENELRFWAATVPRRVNEEHSTEKGDARNMVGERGRPRAAARTLDAII
jgi:hypothetical protein